MRKFFSLAILFVLLIPVSAQENEDDSVLLQQIQSGMTAFEVPRISNSPTQLLDFGFQAGASVFMSGRKDALFSSYIAPELRFHVSPRIQINTGIIYSQGFLPGIGENLYGTSDGRYDSFSFYAEGQYHLTEKFSLSGMVLKDLGATMDPKIKAFQKNTGMQSMGIGAQYKITDNMSFGAQIRFSDGTPMNQLNRHYRHDPFRSPSFFAPKPW